MLQDKVPYVFKIALLFFYMTSGGKLCFFDLLFFFFIYVIPLNTFGLVQRKQIEKL